MTSNPPWANKILSAHWGAIRGAAAHLKLPLPKYLDVSTSVSRAPKILPSDELGCAHYGCVWRSEQEGVAVKLTTDETEAHFVAAAMALTEKGVSPEGIVKYFAIRAVPGAQHLGRPVFMIWREEAIEVGLKPPGYGGGGVTYDQKEFFKLLMRFKELAHEARLVAEQKGKAFNKAIQEVEFYKERLEHTRREYVGAESAAGPYIRQDEKHLARAEKKLGDPWTWIKEQLNLGDTMATQYSDVWGQELKREWGDPITAFLLQRYARNPNKFAWLIECCHQIAVEMENANAMVTYVGTALGEYLENGLLLADVHANNVGTVKREGFFGPIWVITDPGHALPLKPEILSFAIPTL